MKVSPFAASIMGLMGPLVVVQAYAEVYMTEAAAASSLFPDQKWEQKTLELTPDEIKKIEQASGQDVRGASLKYFKDSLGDLVFIDQVLGKHEFITYAVGISPDGQVKGIEVIEYRETYGQKVREAPWRAQFIGKNKTSNLKIGDDIKNISGATLSSAHITTGVKRMIQTYETIRPRI